MPLSRTETYTTTGTKGSWNADPSIVPFNASVAFVLSAGGSVSYKLQYSYDQLTPTQTDADADWFDSTDIPASTSASKVAAFSAPIARVRVIIATLSGSLKMTMLQGLSTN